MASHTSLEQAAAVLERVHAQIREEPIRCAQSCELEVETCANQVHQLLHDVSSGDAELLPVLTALKAAVSELLDRIELIQAFNAGLLARYAVQFNGYDSAGRPATYDSLGGEPR